MQQQNYEQFNNNFDYGNESQKQPTQVFIPQPPTAYYYPQVVIVDPIVPPTNISVLLYVGYFALFALVTGCEFFISTTCLTLGYESSFWFGVSFLPFCLIFAAISLFAVLRRSFFLFIFVTIVRILILIGSVVGVILYFNYIDNYNMSDIGKFYTYLFVGIPVFIYIFLQCPLVLISFRVCYVLGVIRSEKKKMSNNFIPDVELNPYSLTEEDDI